MIKKKLNTLLLLLLVVLSSSLLGTTSYAYNYRVTDADGVTIAKYTYNGSSSWYTSLYNNVIWAVNRVYELGFDTCAIAMDNYNTYGYRVYGFNSSDVASISNSKNVNYMSVSFKPNTTAFKSSITSYSSANSWTRSSTYQVETGFQFGTGGQLRTSYLLISNDLGNNLFSGPWQSSERIVFIEPDFFDIDINADFRNNKVTIDNDTSGTEYYYIPYNSYKIRVGNFFDYSNLQGVIKRKFRYKQNLGDFELIEEYQSDTNNLEFYDILLDSDSLIVYEKNQPDTIEFIIFIPKSDTDFNQLVVPIYFGSRFTSISNGVINSGLTFSGDYYNNYNNDTNTDKIINDVNNDDNVDNIINEELSGDYNSIANKIGYSPLENPFLSIIQFVLNGICNTLLSSGNVTLPLEIRGETYYLHSEDFSTPNGLLSTFISTLLVTFYLFAFYKFGFKIYEKLQSGDFQSVINNLSSNNNNNDWRTM